MPPKRMMSDERVKQLAMMHGYQAARDAGNIIAELLTAAHSTITPKQAQRCVDHVNDIWNFRQNNLQRVLNKKPKPRG